MLKPGVFLIELDTGQRAVEPPVNTPQHDVIVRAVQIPEFRQRGPAAFQQMGPTGVAGLGGEGVSCGRRTVLRERLDQILGAQDTHVEMPLLPLQILENVLEDCRFIRRVG